MSSGPCRPRLELDRDLIGEPLVGLFQGDQVVDDQSARPRRSTLASMKQIVSVFTCSPNLAKSSGHMMQRTVPFTSSKSKLA